MATPSFKYIHIIIPYYSNREYLRLVVKSVLGQDCDKWKLTIIDDAGPENDSAWVKSLNDSRIKYLRHTKNKGIIYNFHLATTLENDGLHTITGPDDKLLSDYVSRALKVMNEHPTCAYYQPGVKVIDENACEVRPLSDRVKHFLRQKYTHGHLTQGHGDKFLASLMTGNWLYQPAIVYNQKVLKTRAMFTGKNDITLDIDEYITSIFKGEQFIIDPQVTFCYRRHRHSYSMTPEVFTKRQTQEKAFAQRVLKQTQGQDEWKCAHRAAKLHLTTRISGLLGGLKK